MDRPPNAAGPWGWLLALALVVYIAPDLGARYTPNTWLVGDGGFYLNMQKSLTRHGTLDQSGIHPHSWYKGRRSIDDAFSNISLGRNGEWWPKHSYLMPIAALPFYWVFGVPGTLVFNVLTMIGMVLLGYLLARRVAGPGIAAATALLCTVGGPFLAFSYNFSNDGFACTLALGGLLALTARRHALGGALWGLAIWSKITCALLGPVYLAVLLADPTRRRAFLRFAGATAVPLLGFAVANTVMFGAPWITSYHRVLVVSDGVLAVASHTDLFNVSWSDGLSKMAMAPRHGLVTAFPVTLIAALGFVPMFRSGRRGLALGILASALAMVIFYARYDYYMERFLFPVFVLMMVPAAALAGWLADLLPRIDLCRRLWVGGLVASLIAVGVVRFAVARHQAASYGLADHIEDARVYLGETHCDYFNNMRWSWECVGKDRGTGEFVGVNAEQVHEFDGLRVRDFVFVGGHRASRKRSVVFPEVPLGQTLVLKYGLDDKSKAPCHTDVRVLVGDEEVWRHRIDKPGVLFEKAIDTSGRAGDPTDLTVEVTTRHRARSRLVFDGALL